jgi:hypothetical protein
VAGHEAHTGPALDAAWDEYIDAKDTVVETVESWVKSHPEVARGYAVCDCERRRVEALDHQHAAEHDFEDVTVILNAAHEQVRQAYAAVKAAQEAKAKADRMALANGVPS